MAQAEGPKTSARCPYCDCGFTPAEPGQVYCSAFCEQQDALEKKRREESS